MTADDIVRQVAKMHEKDLVMPECVNGSRFNGTYTSKIDLWVLQGTVHNHCMYGYEVKVSKPDFRMFTKWGDYMSMCNKLYFVTLEGVIEDGDLPSGVGHYLATEDGLTLVKQAEHREIAFPEGIFLSLAVNRMDVKKRYIVDNDWTHKS